MCLHRGKATGGRSEKREEIRFFWLCTWLMALCYTAQADFPAHHSGGLNHSEVEIQAHCCPLLWNQGQPGGQRVFQVGKLLGF
jgi:hypothetical protein